MDIDTLRKEMIKRGCNNSQLDSKVVPIILDIINNTDNKYVDLWKQEKFYSEKLSVLERSCRWIEEKYNKIKQSNDDIQKQWDKISKYIEQFNQELLKCETSEGRDAMRRAQLFVNSIRLNTKYDNTAFIIGLAAILSNGKIGAIDELKKINPDFIKKLKCNTDYDIIEL